jgi:nitrogen fixation protein FixH
MPEPPLSHLMKDSIVRAPLTGQRVLLMLFAFFGVVIGANLIMMKLAMDTMPGLEVDSSYRAGMAYNAEIADARRQASLGWRVEARIARSTDGSAVLEVEARDRDGVPVTGIVFAAQFERPVDKRADRSVALVAAGSGAYRGQIGDLASGQWDLLLRGERNSERVFLSRNRLELR